MLSLTLIFDSKSNLKSYDEEGESKDVLEINLPFTHLPLP